MQITLLICVFSLAPAALTIIPTVTFVYFTAQLPHTSQITPLAHVCLAVPTYQLETLMEIRLQADVYLNAL